MKLVYVHLSISLQVGFDELLQLREFCLSFIGQLGVLQLGVQLWGLEYHHLTAGGKGGGIICTLTLT